MELNGLTNLHCNILAGKATTNEELEEMLEQGNSAVFTQGVSCIQKDTLLFLILFKLKTELIF